MSDLGKEIIDETMGDSIGEEARVELLAWIEQENAEAALEIGMEHNARFPNSETSQCVLDEMFGRGYLTAIRHLEEKLKGK